MSVVHVHFGTHDDDVLQTFQPGVTPIDPRRLAEFDSRLDQGGPQDEIQGAVLPGAQDGAVPDDDGVDEAEEALSEHGEVDLEDEVEDVDVGDQAFAMYGALEVPSAGWLMAEANRRRIFAKFSSENSTSSFEKLVKIVHTKLALYYMRAGWALLYRGCVQGTERTQLPDGSWAILRVEDSQPVWEVGAGGANGALADELLGTIVRVPDATFLKLTEEEFQALTVRVSKQAETAPRWVRDVFEFAVRLSGGEFSADVLQLFRRQRDDSEFIETYGPKEAVAVRRGPTGAPVYERFSREQLAEEARGRAQQQGAHAKARVPRDRQRASDIIDAFREEDEDGGVGNPIIDAEEEALCDEIFFRILYDVRAFYEAHPNGTYRLTGTDVYTEQERGVLSAQLLGCLDQFVTGSKEANKRLLGFQREEYLTFRKIKKAIHTIGCEEAPALMTMTGSPRDASPVELKLTTNHLAHFRDLEAPKNSRGPGVLSLAEVSAQPLEKTLANLLLYLGYAHNRHNAVVILEEIGDLITIKDVEGDLRYTINEPSDVEQSVVRTAGVTKMKPLFRESIAHSVVSLDPRLDTDTDPKVIIVRTPPPGVPNNTSKPVQVLKQFDGCKNSVWFWWQVQNLSRFVKCTKRGMGIVLFDPMGMGKTASSLLCDHVNSQSFPPAERRTLIFCPNSLAFSVWRKEILNIIDPGAKVLVLSGVRLEDVTEEMVTSHRYAVCPYHLKNSAAFSDKAFCEKFGEHFTGVIFDEATQELKNEQRGTQNGIRNYASLETNNYRTNNDCYYALAALVRSRVARRGDTVVTHGGVIAMSGTPIENKAYEIVPLMRLVGSAHCTPKFWTDLADAEETFQAFLAASTDAVAPIIAHDKKFACLPAKRHFTKQFKMSQEQSVRYRNIIFAVGSSASASTAKCTKLQGCEVSLALSYKPSDWDDALPHLRTVLGEVEDGSDAQKNSSIMRAALAEDEKHKGKVKEVVRLIKLARRGKLPEGAPDYHKRSVVVFAMENSHLAALHSELQKAGIDAGVLNGTDPTLQREKEDGMTYQMYYENEFNTNPGSVILVNFKYGAAGLNLQGGSVNIYLSTPFKPTERDQADARTWRTGQTLPVLTYDIVPEKSALEEAGMVSPSAQYVSLAEVIMHKLWVAKRNEMSVIMETSDGGALEVTDVDADNGGNINLALSPDENCITVLKENWVPPAGHAAPAPGGGSRKKKKKHVFESDDEDDVGEEFLGNATKRIQTRREMYTEFVDIALDDNSPINELTSTTYTAVDKSTVVRSRDARVYCGKTLLEDVRRFFTQNNELRFYVPIRMDTLIAHLNQRNAYINAMSPRESVIDRATLRNTLAQFFAPKMPEKHGQTWVNRVLVDDGELMVVPKAAKASDLERNGVNRWLERNGAAGGPSNEAGPSGLMGKFGALSL